MKDGLIDSVMKKLKKPSGKVHEPMKETSEERMDKFNKKNGTKYKKVPVTESLAKSKS